MTTTPKKIDKKTIEYICKVIKRVKLLTTQREMVCEFLVQKPENFIDLIECLGSEYYKIVPKA